MRTSKLNNKELLTELSTTCRSMAEILEKLNFTKTSGNYTTLNKYLKLFEINFVSKRGRTRTLRRYTFEDCFKKNSTIARQHVKSRIIKDNLIPYECAKCGLKDIWNNKKIVLQLEHKNGISNDNSIDNLCFLCPNCHSQTDTYAAKNK